MPVHISRLASTLRVDLPHITAHPLVEDRVEEAAKLARF